MLKLNTVLYNVERSGLLSGKSRLRLPSRKAGEGEERGARERSGVISPRTSRQVYTWRDGLQTTLMAHNSAEQNHENKSGVKCDRRAL